MNNRVIKENLSTFTKNNRGSQKAIAEALGLSQATVAGWMLDGPGNRPVPKEHVPTICRILGCTEDDLYKPMPEKKEPSKVGLEGLIRIMPEELQNETHRFALKLVADYLEKRKQ